MQTSDNRNSFMTRSVHTLMPEIVERFSKTVGTNCYVTWGSFELIGVARLSISVSTENTALLIRFYLKNVNTTHILL